MEWIIAGTAVIAGTLGFLISSALGMPGRQDHLDEIGRLRKLVQTLQKKETSDAKS